MKQAQFYLLNETNIETLACQLATKQWRAGKRVLIACQTEQQAQEIDELLWANEPDSFVPHNLSGEITQYPTPVEISWLGKRNAQRRDVLINLQTQIPNFAQMFHHIIDFVPTDESEKAVARERYKQYRQMGFEMKMENG